MKHKRETAELITARCLCGVGVMAASIRRLSVGLLSAGVPDEVFPCPSCGSTDFKAAREAQQKKSRNK